MSSSLKNKVVVITRSSEQSSESVKKLESLGAKIISFPTVKIIPLKVFNHFDTYAEKLSDFTHIIFTSENAVKYTIDRLNETGIILPENLKVVCVGKKTADKCEEYKIKVDIIPDDYSAKGLLKYFADKNIIENKMFIPSSEIARFELKEGLIEQGAEVIQIPIYDVTLPDGEETESNWDEIKSSKPDLFIFTSPSTFNNFIKIGKIDDPKPYFAEYVIAAIGPTTANAIEETGVSVDIIPTSYTMDSMIDSILDFYKNKEISTT